MKGNTSRLSEGEPLSIERTYARVSPSQRRSRSLTTQTYMEIISASTYGTRLSRVMPGSKAAQMEVMGCALITRECYNLLRSEHSFQTNNTAGLRMRHGI